MNTDKKVNYENNQNQISLLDYLQHIEDENNRQRLFNKRVKEIRALSDEEIVTSNMKLVHKVISETVYNTGADASVDYDDFFQIGCFAVLKASQKYNGSTKFSTYAYSCIRNAIYSYFRTNRHQIDSSKKIVMDCETLCNTVDSNACYDSFSEDCEERISDSPMNQAIQTIYKKAKPATQRNIQVFLQRFDGASIEELSETYNVTPSVISTWIGEGRRFLAKQEELAERCYNFSPSKVV